MTEISLDRLVARINTSIIKLPGGRIVVSIAGIPGSGKTTISALVCAALNDKHGPNTSIVVPMDGYHLTKAALDASEDPALFHARRGAPFTFAPRDLLALVRDLKAVPATSLVAPSFDHAIGDPVPGAVVISPSHRVVIVEGLYLALDEPPWSEICALCDVPCFVQIPLSVARDRVAARHLSAGLVDSLEVGYARWDRNDALNARYILDHRIVTEETMLL
ncbi:hypothetical protein HKX48_002613 [Thoreauomyces humboldtii]|nr:hypothetical protein HKX48_002613 [Thoreauomyces humboldtii]